MPTVKARFENDGQLTGKLEAYAHSALKKAGLPENNAYNSARLIGSIAGLMAARETDYIGLVIRELGGNVTVRIVSGGPAWNPLEELDLQALLERDPPAPEADFDAPQPREQLLKALHGSLSYYHRNQQNEVEYIARKAQPKTLKWVTAAFVLAIVTGVLLRYFGSQGLQSLTAEHILTPIRTMFLNALKMLVVPVVFFSIASSVAGVSDIREYGRIGAKVLLFYTATSFLAIGVGYLVYQGVRPGAGVTLDPGFFTYEAAEPAEISMQDTITNIIPSSFVGAFTGMDMLQIIFLAVLTGAAANLLDHGGDRQAVSNALGLCSRLFLKMAALVMKLIPLATYCAMTLLILDMDPGMAAALVKLVLSMAVGVLGMFLVYGLLFLALVRKNPLRFFKKCLPNFISFITFCSTSAVMPQSLETCGKRLGISSRISSFSMPLGSTINMDGACVYLTLSVLFLAELYQVPLPAEMLVKLALTIVILSMGAPPISGAGFICLSILVQQIGLPMESLGILMGIDQIMSMCRTLINGAGDFLGTSVVASSEGLMDMEVFQRD